jgi:hypothetical protein
MTDLPNDGLDFFAGSAPAASPTAPPTAAEVVTRFIPPPRAPINPPGAKGSRWAKSDTTFGPTGRIVASTGMIAGLVFFIAATALSMDPFVLIGVGIWGMLTFKALRQIWQPVQHHHRR